MVVIIVIGVADDIESFLKSNSKHCSMIHQLLLLQYLFTVIMIHWDKVKYAKKK